MKIKNKAIENAIHLMGGSQVNMARMLGVSRAQVWQWLNNVSLVSIEKAIDIEDKTNGVIRCEDLCPDVNWAVLRNKSSH